MKKTLNTVMIREIGSNLFTNWEGCKNDIKLSGKSLFNLIGLKKTMQEKLTTVEETLAMIASQHGGEPQANGSIIIPEDQRAAAGKALSEFGEELIEIEYNEITLKDTDSLPVAILEAVYEFVRFEE